MRQRGRGSRLRIKLQATVRLRGHGEVPDATGCVQGLSKKTLRDSKIVEWMRGGTTVTWGSLVASRPSRRSGAITLTCFCSAAPNKALAVGEPESFQQAADEFSNCSTNRYRHAPIDKDAIPQSWWLGGQLSRPNNLHSSGHDASGTDSSSPMTILGSHPALTIPVVDQNHQQKCPKLNIINMR